jgi:hypothetical protein
MLEVEDCISHRVKFNVPDDSKHGKARKGGNRSTSGNDPSFMSPLLFENVDLRNTPLSSLRSCSEYNRQHREDLVTEHAISQQSRSFWTSLFSGRHSSVPIKQPRPQCLDEPTFMVEKFRFNQANLYEDESYDYHNEDSSGDTCFGGRVVDNKKTTNVSGRKFSIIGESSIAFDYLFGLKVMGRPQMEIELKTLKSEISSEFTEDREMEVLVLERESMTQQPAALRRVPSLRGFDSVTIALSDPPSPVLLNDREPSSSSRSYFERGTASRTYWISFIALLRKICPSSRGDDLFYETVRIQPFSSGAYLRGMLLAGLSSMFFQIYNIVTWPVELQLFPINIYIQQLLYWNLWLQIILNIIQLPFRLHIHFLCWESSRTVDVDVAINLIRGMLSSESWLLNKSLGKVLDFLIILNLIVTEVYLWGTPRSDPLRNLVISLCATNVLTIVSRVVVATTFSFSMHDPHVLSEARRRGLSKWDLEVLPTFVFTSWEEVNNQECSICLSGFEMGEMLISLPCDKKHSFHASCIRQWLQRQNSCPLFQILL